MPLSLLPKIPCRCSCIYASVIAGTAVWTAVGRRHRCWSWWWFTSVGAAESGSEVEVPASWHWRSTARAEGTLPFIARTS